MSGRSATFLLALFVLLAGCEGVEPDRRPDREPIATHHSGYFIQMPAESGSPGEDPSGGAVISMTTNLPQGTIAYYTSTVYGGADYSAQGFLRVDAGKLTFRRGGFCTGDPKLDTTQGFDLTVIVVPDRSQVLTGPTPACTNSAQCGAGQLQPGAVLAVLGRDFEKLKGDEVTTINGIRAVVTSADYAWPKDACTVPLDIASGAPRVCRESTASIDDDEGGANLRVVAASPIGPLSQKLLCDLYNYTTKEFQKANPWPMFRARTKAWIDAHRPLASRGGTFSLTNRVVGAGPAKIGIAKSPEWLEVDYLLRHKKVAHARIVASKWYSGYTKWDIAVLDLY